MRVRQKRYTGERCADGTARVLVNNDGGSEVAAFAPVELPLPKRATTDALAAPLAPRFDWGALGAGGLHLAWSLLNDCLGSERADALYVEFEWSVVRGLPADGWELNEEAVRSLAEVIPQFAAERRGDSLLARRMLLCPPVDCYGSDRMLS